jgi:hypothetical protein
MSEVKISKAFRNIGLDDILCSLSYSRKAVER